MEEKLGHQGRCMEEVTLKWGFAAWVGVRPAKERGSGREAWW